MIRVAFLGAEYSKEWMGGVNYISNLLFAISQLKEKKIEVIIFLGKNVDVEIYEKLSTHTNIIQDSLFDRKSTKWYIHKILEKLFKQTPMLSAFLHKHKIDVISHSNITDGCSDFVKVNWIPDFQHVHLPKFFTSEENEKRNKSFLKILKQSDKVIVSSYNAYEDAKAFAPEYIEKVNVLQFVSQPNPKIFSLEDKYLSNLEKKYSFKGRFFYLPNQFWKHKNHMFVFKAIAKLKESGTDVLLLCSGHMQDYRNPKYIEEIKAFIEENKLEDNIRLLGLIDYDDVLYFMRFSIAVINPSLFEGWSSTVEECKSIGKNMILSDIDIHREQNPSESKYFKFDDVYILVDILKEAWMDKNNEVRSKVLKEKAQNNLKKRTILFSKKYQDIVFNCVDRPL